jgi:hypothetical protein
MSGDQVRDATRCRQVGQAILERLGALSAEFAGRHGVGRAQVPAGAAFDEYMQIGYRRKERLTEKVY